MGPVDGFYIKPVDVGFSSSVTDHIVLPYCLILSTNSCCNPFSTRTKKSKSLISCNFSFPFDWNQQTVKSRSWNDFLPKFFLH